MNSNLSKVLKIFVLLIIFLNIATVIFALNTTVDPEDPIYEPNKNYRFSLIDIDKLNETNILIFNLQHSIFDLIKSTNTTEDEDKIIYNESERTYYINIDDLSAGTYEYEWKIQNETGNITNQTNHSYEIQKAEPLLEFKLNGEEENITIQKYDSVNITINIHEGLSVNETLQSPNNTSNKILNESINVTQQFLEVGNYTATLNLTGNENYTSKVIKRKIVVEEVIYDLITNKEKYDIGEQAKLSLKKPENASFKEIKIWLLEPGEEWELLFLNETIFDDELKEISIPTNKVGEYRAETKIKYYDDTELIINNYEVINSMSVAISGDTTIKRGEEYKYSAKATKGLEPYTYIWTLHDDTKKEGDEIKVEYEDTGSYDLQVKAKDSSNNTKTTTKKIRVKDEHVLELKIVNKQNNPVDKAELRIDGELHLTDSKGEALIRLFEDIYGLRIFAPGYELHTQSIDLDKRKSLTITLDEKAVQQKNIELLTPLHESTLNDEEVTFSARINLEDANCTFYIAQKYGSWYRELETFKVSNDVLEHTEKLEEKEYTWKIECFVGKDRYVSSNFNFKLDLPSVSTTSFKDESTDAGAIRDKLEEAMDNINSLDFDSQRASNVLGLKEEIERALRTFDRTLRDINSIGIRRDLTEDEKKERLVELREVLKKLEKETPRDINAIETKTFINYPASHEMKEILEKYQERRGLEGRINERSISDMQNKLIIKTEILLSEIYYLDGSKKEITLVSKDITYTGDKNSRWFLLESIPENFSNEKITFITDEDILIENEIIRFSLEEKIVYYFNGYEDIDETEKIYTLLMSDTVFSSAPSNIFTSNVVIAGAMKDSPFTSAIIILALILLIYLFYAFDLHLLILEFFNSKFRSDKLKDLRRLIYDARNYLEKEEFDKTNLIFKEIRLRYEKLGDNDKKIIYEEASDLLKDLNKEFIENLIKKAEEKLRKNSLEEATNDFNDLINIYKELDEESKIALANKISILQKEIMEKNK